MYNILIVDDETIMRTSLGMLVDWEKEGFKIVGDVSNGKQALALLEKLEIDIIITDIKMPVMDGITLIKELNKRAKLPGIIVLSGYNDFSLVRQTFKLGIQDYVLKSDINRESLLECVKNVAHSLEKSSQVDGTLEDKKDVSQTEILKQYARGAFKYESNQLLECKYILSCFEIDDFAHEVVRFGSNLNGTLVNPLLSFANQIPRLVNKCIFCNISASRYVLFYPLRRDVALEEQQEIVKSICEQVVSVWKNYMNIGASVGISSVVEGVRGFTIGLEEALLNVSMKFIFGKGRIHTPQSYDVFEPKKAIEAMDKYKELIEGIRLSFNTKIVAEQQRIFTYLYTLDRKSVISESFYIIYNIAVMLMENNDEIWAVFNTDVNFHEKLMRLESIKQIEMWLINFIRWVADYIEYNYVRKQDDLIERTKCFIYDNFSNPSMSVGAVASYIGFNEKYFSTWFVKEIGTSFSNYITELRIKKAKELMNQTDMKIYEVSESVGYKSVEHFTRVFKKAIGLSPTMYKKI